MIFDGIFYKIMLEIFFMKEKLKSIAQELREDLQRQPDLRAQQLIDLDETIAESMTRFEQNIREDQMADWSILRDQISVIREYAQVAKMRLLCGDSDLVDTLDAMHDELNSEQEVAIQMGRETHQSGGGVTEVLKALLMWKDSPKERSDQFQQ